MSQITNEVLLEKMTGGFNTVNVQLEGILTEAKRTNGRVTKLEDVVKDYLSAERQIAEMTATLEKLDTRVSLNRDFINKSIGAIVIIEIVIGIALAMFGYFK